MSNKKGIRREEIKWCQNEMGGFGIEPCQGASELATTELRVDPEFTGLDTSTIYLCDDCATRLKEHAEEMGYDVEEV